MPAKFLLSGLALLTAGLASASSNWRVDSTFSFGFDPGAGFFHDMELKMGGDSTGPGTAYGWASMTGGYGLPNPITLSFDTTPFYDFLGQDPAQPVLREAFAFGVMDELAIDPPGQQHLVIFTNPLAAQRMQNIAYGTIFGTSNQPYQYTEEDVILALENLHSFEVPEDQKGPYRTIVENFRDKVAAQANVGPNGTVDSAYFTPDEGATAVIFSDGQSIGSGTVSFTVTPLPVPEPMMCATLALGALTVMRRRRR